MVPDRRVEVIGASPAPKYLRPHGSHTRRAHKIHEDEIRIKKSTREKNFPNTQLLQSQCHLYHIPKTHCLAESTFATSLLQIMDRPRGTLTADLKTPSLRLHSKSGHFSRHNWAYNIMVTSLLTCSWKVFWLSSVGVLKWGQNMIMVFFPIKAKVFFSILKS